MRLGEYGEVQRMHFKDKWYAGKTILKTLFPEYPNVEIHDIEIWTKDVTNIMKFTKHPNIENYEFVVQQSPYDNVPVLLSELIF